MPVKSYNLSNVNSAYVTDDNERDSFSIPNFSIDQEKSKTAKNDSPERGTYAKSIQSLFLCISMSVGLGNIWRFPNIAYLNGGAAFLIPYLLLLIIIGRPLYYLELIIGQFSSQGPVKLWRCVPALKGLGYAQIISVSFVVIFYNYLMALSLYYMFASMQSCLPWSECNYANSSESLSQLGNMTPSEYFWRKEVLEETDLNDVVTISWKLVLCLLLTWIIVYLAVVQGQDSLGKMSYFTAIFPYVVLILLLIIGCLEEGAVEGIKYFFIPDWSKLADITVWYKACEQSFFSLSVGYGNIAMIASYNKFNHNIYRDAIMISILDTFTNILAGCVIFAVLGSLSVKYNRPVGEVVNHKDLGLAFVAYPEALERIQYVPQLWSILFFFMLFTLGIGGSMSQIETILTVIKDRFPNLRERKWLLSLCICILFFSLGLPLTTSAGQVILLLLNNFGVGAAVFLYAILEVVGITWIYGLKNFCQDVSFMLNRPVGIFWKITWSFTAPVALMIIFIYGMASKSAIPDEKGMPSWGVPVGWFLACLALIQIPLWFIFIVRRDPHSKLIKSSVGRSWRGYALIRPRKLSSELLSNVATAPPFLHSEFRFSRVTVGVQSDYLPLASSIFRSYFLYVVSAMIVMLTVLCLSLRVGGSPFNPPLSTSSSFLSLSSCIDGGLSLSLEGSVENLERLLYHVAKGKGVSPTTILNRLGRKVKGRQRMDTNRSHGSSQDFGLNGKLNKVKSSRPVATVNRDTPPRKFRGKSMDISGFLPERTAISASEVPQRFPFQTIKSPHIIHSFAPAPLFIPVRSFKPPPGVTVRVNAGDMETQLPDVIVTLSPMMTVDEALRQADSKFREVLGVSENEDMIAFSYSPFFSCVIIDHFNNLRAEDIFAWKVVISDIQGQVIYDNVCLPNSKQVPIKPGTTISLSYVPL